MSPAVLVKELHMVSYARDRNCFLKLQLTSTNWSSFLPRLYGIGVLLPLGKNWIVGKEVTPYLPEIGRFCSSSAFICATTQSFSDLKAVATFSYAGFML